MMNCTTAFLSAAIMLTAAAASAATTNLIDFEGLRTGQGQIGTGNTAALGGGVTVTVADPFNFAGATPYTLGVYNSACRLGQPPAPNCTGGDDDLATGAGLTLPSISAGEDTPAEDYILVTPQGSGSSFADRVSKALFTFAFDLPSIVKNLVLIDIDEVGTAVNMTFTYADGSLPQSFNAAAATWVKNAGKDNSYSFFDIENDKDLLSFRKPVTSFSIQFGTRTQSISGGIAGFAYTPAPIPVPAALPLLVGALGMLGWAARRRKAA